MSNEIRYIRMIVEDRIKFRSLEKSGVVKLLESHEFDK